MILTHRKREKSPPTMHGPTAEDAAAMRQDVAHSRKQRFVKRAGGRGDLIHEGRHKAKHMKRRLIAFLKKQPLYEGIRLK